MSAERCETGDPGHILQSPPSKHTVEPHIGNDKALPAPDGGRTNRYAAGAESEGHSRGSLCAFISCSF
jgi:hypothetical protein